MGLFLFINDSFQFAVDGTGLVLPFIFEPLLNHLAQMMEQTKGTESRRPVAVGLDAVKKLCGVLVTMSSRGRKILHCDFIVLGNFLAVQIQLAELILRKVVSGI